MDETRSELECWLALQNAENWKPIKVRLAARLSEATQRLVTARDEVSVRILQGRAQELRELLNLIDTAGDRAKVATAA